VTRASGTGERLDGTGVIFGGVCAIASSAWTGCVVVATRAIGRCAIASAWIVGSNPDTILPAASARIVVAVAVFAVAVVTIAVAVILLAVTAAARAGAGARAVGAGIAARTR